MRVQGGGELCSQLPSGALFSFCCKRVPIKTQPTKKGCPFSHGHWASECLFLGGYCICFSRFVSPSCGPSFMLAFRVVGLQYNPRKVKPLGLDAFGRPSSMQFLLWNLLFLIVLFYDCVLASPTLSWGLRGRKYANVELTIVAVCFSLCLVANGAKIGFQPTVT